MLVAKKLELAEIDLMLKIGAVELLGPIYKR